MDTIKYVGRATEDTPPIWLYTAQGLAATLLPKASEWAVDHIAGALEELAKWSINEGVPPKFDRQMVVKEVREMNMAMESRDNIVAQLETITFTCQWVHPNFDSETQGFELL